MNKGQKIKNCITALFLLLAATGLALDPDDGYVLVGMLICLSMLLYAIRKIVFYFAMARNMVGGGIVLLKGIIVLDMSLFLSTLRELPQVYIMLYLFFGMAITGAVDIMRAFEAKHLHAPWHLKMTEGVMYILFSGCCVFSLKYIRLAVYMYCVGMIQAAVIRIIEAARRSEIIYIQ